MDPSLSLLLADEMLAVEKDINKIRNSGITQKEKDQAIYSLTIYGRTVSFFFEELPKLIEHIEQNKKNREAKK